MRGGMQFTILGSQADGESEDMQLVCAVILSPTLPTKHTRRRGLAGLSLPDTADHIIGDPFT
jgi:hypothetical protein